MKLERSDIDFPLWRKKVDSSLFNHQFTPIPNWLCRVWNIMELFPKSNYRKSKESSVKIIFDGKEYMGWVIASRGKRKSPLYRLYFQSELSDCFKSHFVMSYMRSIEADLRKNNPVYEGVNIEEEIPFWEFLDIEFNPKQKIFYCTAYYTQKSLFAELFKELSISHVLRRIENKAISKIDFHFINGNWRSRSELQSQINEYNIIYHLIDTKNKLVYIGEAENLKMRLNQSYSKIPDWDYYRFDKLPDGLTKKQRVAIERLLIRCFASFLQNYKNIASKEISDYILANDRIDK